MIRHILFDFDGTMVQSMGLTLQILGDLSGKYHHRRVHAEEMRSLTGLPILERFKRVGLPPYRVPEISREFAALYRQSLALLQPVDGIRELLRALKGRGLSLSVLSSNSVDNIAAFFQSNDMDFFDHIISANSLFGKDRSIRNFLRRFGAQREELLYVGDELRDIEACKLAGVAIVAVTWGFDPAALLESGNPDYIARAPSDILEAVAQSMARSERR